MDINNTAIATANNSDNSNDGSNEGDTIQPTATVITTQSKTTTNKDNHKDANNKNSSTTTNEDKNKSYIYLPKKCSLTTTTSSSAMINTTTLSSLLSWKVKSGSIVRQGEVIGYVINDNSTTTKGGEGEEVKTNNNISSIEDKENTTSTTTSTTKLSSRQLLRQRMKKRQDEKKLKDENTNKQNNINDKIISPINGILEIYDSIQKYNNNNIIINITANNIKLGIVEPCKHTTIFSGLCAICGISIKQLQLQQSSEQNNDPNNQQIKTKKAMSRYTIANGLLSIINLQNSTSNVNNELNQISNQYINKLKEKKKLLLILDLDHTLVHATSDIRALPLLSHYSRIHDDNNSIDSSSDIRSLSLPINETTNTNINIVNNYYQRHTIKLRPYIKEIFHPSILDKYEIGIYTAGTKGYALKVTNVISRYMLNIKEDEDDDIYINKELYFLECCYKDFQYKLINLNKNRDDHYGNEMNDIDEKTKENISIDEEIKEKKCDNDEKSQNVTTKTTTLENHEKLSLKIDDNDINKQVTNSDKKENIITTKNTSTTSDQSMQESSSSEIDTNNKTKESHEDSDTSSTPQVKEDEATSVTTTSTIEQDQSKDNENIAQSKKRKEIPKDENDNNTTNDEIIANKKQKKHVTFNILPEQQQQTQKPLSKEEEEEKQNIKSKLKIIKSKIKLLKHRLQYIQQQNIKVKEYHKKIFGSSSNSSNNDSSTIDGSNNSSSSSRIISRNETMQDGLHRDIKSIKKFFPNGNNTMCICIDDREDVWANCIDNFDYNNNESSSNANNSANGEPPKNLLWCKPFHWKSFMGFLDVNTIPTPSSSTTTNITTTLKNNNVKSNNNNDEKNQVKDNKSKTSLEKEKKDNDCQLLHTCNMLKQLHSIYYNNNTNSNDNNNNNVNDILSTMRKNVLGPKTIIVFSGLVPLHKQNQYNNNNNNKARPSVIRYAQDLGATVVQNLNANVTHVVAAKDGTDKIGIARKYFPNVKIVNAVWLYECYWSMTHCDVTPFLMLPTIASGNSNSNIGNMNNSKKKDNFSNHESGNSDPNKNTNVANDKNMDGSNNVEKVVSSNKEQKGRNILLDDDDDTDDDDDSDDDLMLDLEKEMMDNT